MSEPGPYTEAAETYWAAGWRGIIPIPYRRKKYPPEGWTGHGGAWPSFADVYDWAQNPDPDTGGGNIALRLPHDIIGVDVDDYGDKIGGGDLEHLERQWGALPDTWRSTSRNDGTSGIRLYHVPEGLAWPGELSGSIEIIQYCHRYAVVWPSIHPEGRTYRWIAPGGAISTVVPAVDDIPELPDAWLAGVTGGEMVETVTKATLDLNQVQAWLIGRRPFGMCRRMQGAVDTMLGDLAASGSAHPTLRRLMRLARAAEQGHPGVLDAITAVNAAFMRAATNPARAGEVRTRRAAQAEWERSLTGAVNRIIGNPSVSTTVRTDPCDDPFADLIAAPNPSSAITTTAATVGSLAVQVEHNTADDTAAAADDGDTADADDRLEAEIARRHEEAKLLAQEIAYQRARRAAKHALDEEDAAAAFREPPWRPTLTAELAIPDEPVVYTVDEVMPTGANVLLTAQYKTGKTTLVNDLARSLADGHPFLDRFTINTPPGRVGIFNYEVDARQYRRWLRELNITNTDLITPLNLRGYRLPLISQWVEDWLVRWLSDHEIGVWIVDPFARAFVGSGQSENDNTEVGRFLDTLDVIKGRAGVSDLIMPTHTGRGEMEEGQERARGATRLDDWADVRWLLTKDEHDARYFRATGRDVEFNESQIVFNEQTRRLSLHGGNRQQGKRSRVGSAILAVIEQQPGVGSRQLRAAVREALGACSHEAFTEAVELLEETGRVRVEEGSGRRPTRHYLSRVSDLVEGS
jgi:hypothetical protein